MTDKQNRFVSEYLIDLNAKQAAIRAGYSERRAGEIGYQLLHKTTIQAAIQKSMKNRQQRTEITQDYVIDKLVEIAEKEASDAPDSDLKYSSKIKTLELLGKHVGAFDKKEDTPQDVVKIIFDV